MQHQGHSDTLQQVRVDAVARRLRAVAARSVLDLGCGPGELLARLAAEPQFTRLVGIDLSAIEIGAARQLLTDAFGESGRVTLRCASFMTPDDQFQGFDAAVLMETIEHVDPGRLGEVERAVFGHYAPKVVIVTTPNSEYNVVYGMGPGEFRHPDHRFEWSRSRFRAWANGVAARNGYRVHMDGIGEAHDAFGQSTQIAEFSRQEQC